MLMRKVPGFVPASPWGLRLPQKFLFLLFLSGLVTLCFGALFLLPHSSRLKRLFLAPRTQQPGLEVVAEIAGHAPAREQEPPPNPAPAAPAPGEDDPSSWASPRRRKGGLRRTRPTGPREEATAARGNSIPASRPGDEGVPFRFDFNAFRSRLRHPVLGTRADESQEPQSQVRAQREKIKEMMQFAWQSYKRYAMGKNELRPLTKDGYEGNMFGANPSGEDRVAGKADPCVMPLVMKAGENQRRQGDSEWHEQFQQSSPQLPGPRQGAGLEAEVEAEGTACSQSGGGEAVREPGQITGPQGREGLRLSTLSQMGAMGGFEQRSGMI
eukprot:XP_016857350.1 mannosyl-oligosaccharide 1,2-alpha-mannosidase IC isoform X2 [Homo sapiens]